MTMLVAVVALSGCGQSPPEDPFAGTWETLGDQPLLGQVVISEAHGGYRLAAYRPSGEFIEGWEAQREGVKLIRPGYRRRYTAALDSETGELDVNGTRWFGLFERVSGDTQPPSPEASEE